MLKNFNSRFAPSNTGYLHLGSARTALFAYAIAKANGGTFSLRIEDTDKQRSTKESLLDILHGLRWLGIDWENHGPSINDVNKDIYNKEWFQSQRNEFYQEIIHQLLKSKNAYQENDVIMFKMPNKDIVLKDMILGEIKFTQDQFKDFPITRNDGSPLFHLTNVADDIAHNNGILIKGNDHLSNSPKHIAIFQALNADVPAYAHLPLILDDKGAKLSKRRTDQFVLIKDFIANGYLPSAIINLLGTMGWSPKDRPEYFDISYICKSFKIEDCLKANPRYDMKKLDNINTHHIRNLSKDELIEKMMMYNCNFAEQAKDKYPNIQHYILPRCKTLKDIVNNSQFIIAETIEYNKDDVEKHLDKNVVIKSIDKLKNLDQWQKDNIMSSVKDIVNETGLSIGKVSMALRVALTGKSISPPIDDTFVILGRHNSLNRLKNAITN